MVCCRMVQAFGPCLVTLLHGRTAPRAATPPPPLSAEAHQLGAWYSMPLEAARAVQAVGVNALVADHLLPQASRLFAAVCGLAA